MVILVWLLILGVGGCCMLGMFISIGYSCTGCVCLVCGFFSILFKLILLCGLLISHGCGNWLLIWMLGFFLFMMLLSLSVF